MLAEGVHPPSIEQAATQAGYPAPVAAALRRAEHGADAQDPQGDQGRRRGATATPCAEHPAERGHRPDDRRVRPPGQARGRRLLRVRATASARGLWPGLRERVPGRRDRRRSRSRTSRSGCCSSRRSRPRSASTRASSSPSADANIGSIMGIGFPAEHRRRRAVHDRLRGRSTVTAQESARSVSQAFLDRADELAETVRRALPPHDVPPRPGGEGRVLPGLRPRTSPILQVDPRTRSERSMIGR